MRRFASILGALLLLAAPSFARWGCANAADTTLPTVSTPANLKSLTTSYPAVMVTDVSGAAITYRWSPSNCAAEDGVTQVAPNAGTGCWVASTHTLVPGNLFSTATAPIATIFESNPGTIAALLRDAWLPGTSTFLGISTEFTAANDPIGANFGSPRFGEMVVTRHNNSAAATVPLGAIDVVYANTVGQPFAANFVVAGGAVIDGADTAWNGVEIDVQPLPGSTNIQSNGLILNAFNVPFTSGISPAIEVTGTSGGKWGTGIYLQPGSLNGGVGLELNAASTKPPSISQGIRFHSLTSDPATTTADIVEDDEGNINLLPDATRGHGFVIANPMMAVTRGMQIGGAVNAAAMGEGEVVLARRTVAATAPGAAFGKLAFVCGTNAGTAKLVAYAGTSSVPSTVLDNIGGGVTGC